MKILKENPKQSEVYLGLSRPFSFQHDNHPQHTSLLVINYLQKTKVNVMEWSSQAPHLYLIENMRGDLKKNIHARRESNLNDLPKNNGPGE